MKTSLRKSAKQKNKTVKIFYPTCVTNRVKTHEKPIQVIQRDRKSNLIKADMISIADAADLIEVQRESYDDLNYKSVELRTIFVTTPKLVEMEFRSESSLKVGENGCYVVPVKSASSEDLIAMQTELENFP